MNASNNIDAFRATAICRDLADTAAAQLFAMADPFAARAGTRLVRQGEPSRGAFLLHSGSCEARVTLPGGGERPVAHFSAGAMFGETALLDQGLCSASVFATSDMAGWFIDRDAFRALAAGRNTVALAIARNIALGLVDRLGALNAELLRHPAAEDRVVADRVPDGDPLADIQRRSSADFSLRRFLPVLPVFSGFSPSDIDAVVAPARSLSVERGQWLFAAGQQAAACFLVVRGAVEVSARRDERERRLALLGPGSLLGYLSVLASGVHGANARVRESADLLEFPAADFRRLFAGLSGAEARMQHAIQRAMLGSLARSNSQLSRLVTQESLGEALRTRAAQAAI
jgi:CRP-like cAMP-binding protein